MAKQRWEVFTDGASRGNPGPAAIGAVIFDASGVQVHAISEAIGRATNNVAEYRSAIAGLEAAKRLGALEIDLCMDSELVVRQLLGRYRVRNAKLQPLWARLVEISRTFSSFTARSIPRAENALADRLANQALDLPPRGAR